ncbi:MAG: SIMPL domain-containing protein [Hyphomicrobiales bacterium]|nr:SIMPL domain-containing protein [Hyphomicrobiales bacterium]
MKKFVRIVGIGLFAAIGFTALPAKAAEKLITVTGEATVSVAPDAAAIRVGVSSSAKTAREASDGNAKQMTAVLAAIKEAGIADRDVQTSRLSLQPHRAIAAGANEMSGIEFVVSEQSKLLDQARDDAIADARRKAELFAKAAGVKVGQVLSIVEEGSAPPQRPMVQAMRAGAVPVAPGEQTLRAQATVTYAIVP